jgi:hypothetical protein
VVNDAGATITYDGSSSSASAIINVPVDDAGTVSVGAGTLNVPPYVPASTSTTTIGVSASSGQISVAGVATLNGALYISTAPGYLPPIGKKITILTASSLSGTFSSVIGNQMTGEHWAVSYTSTSVVLSAVSG